MPKQAMNLTFGDLVMLEIALVHYLQNLDLSMQSGQYVTELIGKLEFNMSDIKNAAAAIKPVPLQPAPIDPAPPEKPQ